jgi:HPt (histidine-containing phosphotransfer) domain-containing protein
VASFAGRRQALEALLPLLQQHHAGDPAFDEACKSVGAIAHKLSGAAETYGFPTLTRASAALEDWVGSQAGAPGAQQDVVAFAELLAKLLGKTQVAAKDVDDLASDPIFARLEATPKNSGR